MSNVVTFKIRLFEVKLLTYVTSFTSKTYYPFHYVKNVILYKSVISLKNEN
jgi:hypothetical protein